MIKKYALMKLKYDFMGYTFSNSSQLSFHHLIVPRRLCKKEGLGDGFYEWNGAIDDVLNQFEREYCGLRTKNNHLVIKDNYVKRIKPRY